MEKTLMALEFLKENNQSILESIDKELHYIDSTIYLSDLQEETVTGLQKVLMGINEDIALHKTGVYGSWLHNENYIRDTLLQEAVTIMISEKENRMNNDKLSVGDTYYSHVEINEDTMAGYKALYLGGRYTNWQLFTESVGINKAMTMLRYGDTEDFKQIYVGMANGTTDGLNRISISHITESSKSALRKIAEYCDNRWSGAWPWEVESPEKLKFIIEARGEKHMKLIEEMQFGFMKLLREFEEIQMDQFEMVNATQDMMKRVDGMITDLGKLSSTGIEVMAQAKAANEDGSADPMQEALGEPLNHAVEALTNLKAALTKTISSLTGGDIDNGENDLGSPMDAMGDKPDLGDTGDNDNTDDFQIGGDESERPMKDM